MGVDVSAFMIYGIYGEGNDFRDEECGEEGKLIEPPLVELFYKDDALNDPFISDEQAIFLKAASQKEIDELKAKARKINQELKEFYFAAGLILVDFKLEFGLDKKGQITLADEITPDTCRLWDEKTLDKMDKDRFRQDLGQVDFAYEKVFERLKNQWEKKL